MIEPLVTEPLEAELQRIIDAAGFQSPEMFFFAGRQFTAWTGANPALYAQPAIPGAAQIPIVQTLQNVLYGSCYSKPFRGAIDDSVQPISGEDAEWVGALSAANATKERWEEGWQVQQFLQNGQVQAFKRGASRAFWPGEFISRSVQGMAPQPGAPIAAFFPRESRSVQPGFYFAFGETTGDQQDDYSTVRYYWNLRREGAVPLVRSLTAGLNRYQAPFRFKIVNHPAMLDRSDAAILYVSRRYYRIAAELAQETHAAVSTLLEDAVPLFTKRLGKGLGFAEDPGTGESFGMSRCRILAEGLWLAFQERRFSAPDRLERVRDHFAASGISLERPHLNFAKVDPYEFPQ
jgi:HopA1 effector protein family